MTVTYLSGARGGVTRYGSSLFPRRKSAYAVTVAKDTPISWYRGSVVDLGSLGQNASVVGSPTFGSPGLIAGDSQTAINFGGNGKLSVPTTGLPSGNVTMSFEFWMYFSSLTGINFDQPMAFGTRTANEDIGAFINGTNGGAIALGLFGASTISSGISVAANTIYYVVCTLDGVAHAQTIDVWSAGGHGSGSGAVSTTNVVYGSSIIGNDVTGGANIPFHGIGQDFATYNYVLSSAQRLTHWQAGSIG